MPEATDPIEYEISVAGPEDLPELLELQRANLAVNGGALSVEFSSDWFERSMQEMPIVIARRGGQLAGYLVSSSRLATRHLALTEAKFRAYPAVSDAYNSGPLCIAGGERGRGLSAILIAALQSRLPGREATAFIRRDNTSSRTAHVKAGFREVADFSHAGIDYVVVVANGPALAG
jgi:L-amino acid N-acyltransferase YncA